MTWNGSGTYSPPAATFPEVNGTVIDAGRYNPTLLDLAAGITASLAKNGENIPTADLPMGGFVHTGLGQAAATGQTLAWGKNASIVNLAVTGTFTLPGTPVSGITDLTTTGNTVLGDAVGDTLNVANGSLYINGVGNVGIGTTTPDTCRFTIKQPASTGIAGVNMFNDAGTSNFVFTAGSAHAVTNWRNNLVLFTGGAQDILFYTNNIDRGRFDSAGRLGVGMIPLGDTSSYGGKTVEVSGPVYARQSSDNTKYLAIGAAGGNAFIAADGAGQGLIVQITGAEAMRIDNSRRVGVGRVPTLSRLEVEATTGDVLLVNSTAAAGGYATWATSGTIIGYVGSAQQLVAGGANTELGIRGVTTIRFAIGATEALSINAVGKLTATDGSGLASLNASNLASGTVATARLGSGTANSGAYLAGDSTWKVLSIPTAISGSYTPAATAVSNCSAATGNKSQYLRVGNTVTVSGSVTITVTAGGAALTEVDLSLPIASNLGVLSDLCGAFTVTFATQAGAMRCDADTVNDRARLQFASSSSGGGCVLCFHFTYEVLP